MTTRLSLAVAVLAIGAAALPASAQRNSSNLNQQNSASQQAGKQVHDAQLAVTKIQMDEAKIRNRVRNELMAKPEWASVLANKRKAEAVLEQARKNALASVQNKPEYKDLMKERETAQAQLASGNSGGAQLSDEEVQKASGVMVKDGLQIKQMEKAALAEDPKYAEAKAQNDAANAKLTELDAQVEQALKADQEYQQLDQQLAQAKTQLDAAHKQLAQARQQEQEQRLQEEKSRQSQGNRGGSGGGGRGR